MTHLRIGRYQEKRVQNFFTISSIIDLQWGRSLFLIQPFREGRLQYLLGHIFFDICQNRYMIALEESREKHQGEVRMAELLDD
jgi:hypothetical protein